MGIGPCEMVLYKQFKLNGLFKNVSSVVELGAQNIFCEGYENSIKDLLEVFGKEKLMTVDELKYMANSGPAGTLYKLLGFNYKCIDINGDYGAIPLDLNFEAVPAEHKGRYQFTTNHGTTEHLMNQINAFEVIHDLTSAGGYMMHGLPFRNYTHHGFFCYTPEFYYELAKYNSYEFIAMWFVLDISLNHLIPYDDNLLKFLNNKGDSALLVLLRKTNDAKFIPPIQGMYESSFIRNNSARYSIIAGPKKEEAKPSEDNRYKIYLNTLIKWHKARSRDKEISDILKSDNIKSLSIYGAGEIGKILIPELMKNFKVNYLIDQNPQLISTNCGT